jgi:S1-C subfamily serine protease
MRLRLCLAVCALAAGCGSAEEPPEVVRVSVATGGLVPEVATGVAAGDGRVLTVAHALSGRHAVTAAGRPARVVRVDRRLDLALLEVPGLRAPALRFGRDARRVALVVVRGRRPRMVSGSIRRHVLVRWRDQPGDPPRDRPGIELAASVEPGASGAPVIDGDGRLLGVLYARSGDGTAWAVDASAARTVLAPPGGPARKYARRQAATDRRLAVSSTT